MNTFKPFILGIAVLSVMVIHNVEVNAANFAGKWVTTSEMPDGESRDGNLTLSKNEGQLKGTLIGRSGDEIQLDRVKTEGKTLNIEFDYERDGQSGVIGAKASLNKDGALIGKWYIRGEDGEEVASNEWKAVRSAASIVAGKWDVVAVTTENDLEHVMVIKKSGSSFSGYTESDEGLLDYTSVSAKKNEVRMELPYGGGTVKVEAKLTQPRKLVGKWIFFDEFKEEVANGDWSATKQKRAKKKE